MIKHTKSQFIVCTAMFCYFYELLDLSCRLPACTGLLLLGQQVLCQTSNVNITCRPNSLELLPVFRAIRYKHFAYWCSKFGEHKHALNIYFLNAQNNRLKFKTTTTFHLNKMQWNLTKVSWFTSGNIWTKKKQTNLRIWPSIFFANLTLFDTQSCVPSTELQ